MGIKKSVKKVARSIKKKTDCPDHLENLAKKKWQELYPLLEKKKVITECDLIALETLCINYAMSLDLYNAMKAQSEDGKVAGYFKDRNSQTMGEYNAYYKCQATYMRLLNEFGLTPKSRKNIAIEIEDEAQDPISELINE